MANRIGKRKAEIRARYLGVRREMSQEEAKAKSETIMARLRVLPEFRRAKSVLTYVASKDNEVDTQPLIASLLAESRVVLVPVVRKGGEIVWSRLKALSELGPGSFGILEPRDDCLRPTEPSGESVVVVPGIAFTPEGLRIGYGGGYFDRFLVGFGGLKVALAYECQVTRDIPVESHDVAVDAVVTESGVYDCLGELGS